MPLIELTQAESQLYGVWHVAQSDHLIASHTDPPPHIVHPTKRIEWITSRKLMSALLSAHHLPFFGIGYDEYQKPFLRNHSLGISLSHAYPYVAAIVGKSSQGIDVQQFSPKLSRVAPRFLSREEYQTAGQDLTTLCVYWCAKEALYKLYGRRGISLAMNLYIHPFSLRDRGVLKGSISCDGEEQTIALTYRVYTHFVLVFTHDLF